MAVLVGVHPLTSLKPPTNNHKSSGSGKRKEKRIMGKKETIEEKTWNMIQPVCEELGLIPVDAEYVKERNEYSLLIYVDKEGGVTIDDCEALSRVLDPMLDEANFINDAYTMIVSSPGLGRQIKRPRDFIFAKGKEVDVRLYKAKDGNKELTGFLKDFDKDSIILAAEAEATDTENAAAEGSDGSNEQTIARSEIAQIRLHVDF